MFQDEARFGRICDPKRCWAPGKIRPVVSGQIVREYTYAYGAVSPLEGDFDGFILPTMHTQALEIFLKEISIRYPENYIMMVMDGAPGHSAKDLKIPKNVEILKLPPYSPQLNPSENIWDEMREKWFGNQIFDSMDDVENRLIEAIRALEESKDIIKSIAGFPWILNAINTV